VKSDYYVGPDEDPGKYTKMPDPKAPKFRNFYPNRFGQFLSEIWTTRPPNPIFIQISDQALKNCFFSFFYTFPMLRAFSMFY
jgi:hypothetical protein